MTVTLFLFSNALILSFTDMGSVCFASSLSDMLTYIFACSDSMIKSAFDSEIFRISYILLRGAYTVLKIVIL